MKKLLVVLLCAMVLFTSCKKKTDETPVAEDEVKQIEACIFTDAIMPHLPDGTEFDEFVTSADTDRLFPALAEDGLTDIEALKTEAETCGYADLLNQYIKYLENTSQKTTPSDAGNGDTAEWDRLMEKLESGEGVTTEEIHRAEGELHVADGTETGHVYTQEELDKLNRESDAWEIRAEADQEHREKAQDLADRLKGAGVTKN